MILTFDLWRWKPFRHYQLKWLIFMPTFSKIPGLRMEIAPREIGVNWQQTNGRTDVQRTDGRPHGRPAHITPVTAYCWRQKSIIKFTYIAPSIAHSVQHVYNQTTLKFQMLTESYNTYLPAINCRQPVLFQLHQYGRNMDYLFLHVVTIVFSCFCKSLEWF